MPSEITFIGVISNADLILWDGITIKCRRLMTKGWGGVKMDRKVYQTDLKHK